MGSKCNNKLENESSSSSCSERGTPQRRRTKNKAEIIHSCSACGFESRRHFNVVRHYERIHGPLKRPIACCGKKYSTKGQFYQHSADKHPESRRASFVSKIKYKITRSSVVKKKKKTTRRRSLRNLKPKIEVKEENDEDASFDDDTPLINYLKSPRLTVKKEEKFTELKKEKTEVETQNREKEDQRKPDLSSIQILFEGDITSQYHAEIQSEFLRDIDFESFHLV